MCSIVLPGPGGGHNALRRGRSHKLKAPAGQGQDSHSPREPQTPVNVVQVSCLETRCAWHPARAGYCWEPREVSATKKDVMAREWDEIDTELAKIGVKLTRESQAVHAEQRWLRSP